MGQSNSKSQQRSKAQLLYDIVSIGNVEAIEALRREGTSLEWIDSQGRTPLILAFVNPELIHVAKPLIELGANVNAYCPGARAGTPLHHAAKKGLEQSVKLLLSHGANALVRNDDCQTPLDVARVKGHTNVVRAIENHVCYFSGWLREFYGPSFLEALAPKLLSRTIWVVVAPFGCSNSTRPLKMELIIYPTLQVAQPRSVIALWNAKTEEPVFHQKDAALTIVDQFTETRYKLTSAIEGDTQQLQRLHNACMGIPQVMPPPVLDKTQTSTLEAAPQTLPDSGTVGNTTQHGQTGGNVSPVAPTNSGVSTSPSSAPVPSAPPIPVYGASVTNDVKDDGNSSSCIICCEAPVEGACIPCGHMAGCMSCLVDINAKKCVCPVCQSKINQIVRLYAV